MTPSEMRGVLNDALSVYFADATLANAFVARWCVGASEPTIERRAAFGVVTGDTEG
jgi:hypothetical protein